MPSVNNTYPVTSLNFAIASIAGFNWEPWWTGWFILRFKHNQYPSGCSRWLRFDGNQIKV